MQFFPRMAQQWSERTIIPVDHYLLVAIIIVISTIMSSALTGSVARWWMQAVEGGRASH